MAVALNCPQCSSTRLYKDGLRYLRDGSHVQRYLCRVCGFRFSETLNRLSSRGFFCQVGAAPSPRRVRNLVKVESLKEGLAGATGLADARNEFAEQLGREGYSKCTIKACVHYLDRMERKGINIFDTEQVKTFIAEQNWQNHSKATVVVYYGIFAKIMHLQWDPPRYRYQRKIPFIPLEGEIDDLIAGCGRKMSVFLRLLKETGARVGEALRLRWEDFDFEKSTVTINNPEKNSLSRILSISPTLKAMLNSLSRKSNRIFSASMNTMQSNFRRQRNRLAVKLKNQRLKRITFHTFGTCSPQYSTLRLSTY